MKKLFVTIGLLVICLSAQANETMLRASYDLRQLDKLINAGQYVVLVNVIENDKMSVGILSQQVYDDEGTKRCESVLTFDVGQIFFDYEAKEIKWQGHDQGRLLVQFSHSQEGSTCPDRSIFLGNQLGRIISDRLYFDVELPIQNKKGFDEIELNQELFSADWKATLNLSYLKNGIYTLAAGSRIARSNLRELIRNQSIHYAVVGKNYNVDNSYTLDYLALDYSAKLEIVSEKP